MSATVPSRRVSSGERINAAEPASHLQDALRKRGIRLTRQRRVILEVMDSAEQHLDVDQILERAQKIDPEVHLVTVYRTIDLLKRQGLIDSLIFSTFAGIGITMKLTARAITFTLPACAAGRFANSNPASTSS